MWNVDGKAFLAALATLPGTLGSQSATTLEFGHKEWLSKRYSRRLSVLQKTLQTGNEKAFVVAVSAS